MMRGRLSPGLLLAAVVVTVWRMASLGVYWMESASPGGNIHSVQDAFWWGWVTLLTVGYGDHVPVTLGGRLIAGVLMIAGVVSLGAITAKFSAMLLERAWKEGRGWVNTERLKNHILICGWKEDMASLLAHVLDFNPHLEARDLVVIANVSMAVVDEVRAQSRLKEIQWIEGEYWSEGALARGAPTQAQRIMILAGRVPDLTGHLPSPIETDARTVMAAMTLAKIAKGAMITAEIIDEKMDQYLKLAGVSEILYSREYGRLLIGNASGGTGVANVILDLLDPKKSGSIVTVPLPADAVGRNYRAYKNILEEQYKDLVVIGVLENTGNQHAIREKALNRAQKTPDMRQLLTNLREVKTLQCNDPVFHPDEHYVIPDGAMGIAVRSAAKRGYTHE